MPAASPERMKEPFVSDCIVFCTVPFALQNMHVCPGNHRARRVNDSS